jgi:hypothetical protein
MLEEYDKKQSTWNEKKGTMVRKVAIVQALREAFPAQLGAMYTAEEQGVRIVEETNYTEVMPDRATNAEIIQQEEPESEAQPQGTTSASEQQTRMQI